MGGVASERRPRRRRAHAVVAFEGEPFARARRSRRRAVVQLVARRGPLVGGERDAGEDRRRAPARARSSRAARAVRRVLAPARAAAAVGRQAAGAPAGAERRRAPGAQLARRRRRRARDMAAFRFAGADAAPGDVALCYGGHGVEPWFDCTIAVGAARGWRPRAGRRLRQRVGRGRRRARAACGFRVGTFGATAGDVVVGRRRRCTAATCSRSTPRRPGHHSTRRRRARRPARRRASRSAPTAALEARSAARRRGRARARGARRASARSRAARDGRRAALRRGACRRSSRSASSGARSVDGRARGGGVRCGGAARRRRWCARRRSRCAMSAHEIVSSTAASALAIGEPARRRSRARACATTTSPSSSTRPRQERRDANCALAPGARAGSVAAHDRSAGAARHVRRGARRVAHLLQVRRRAVAAALRRRPRRDRDRERGSLARARARARHGRAGGGAMVLDMAFRDPRPLARARGSSAASSPTSRARARIATARLTIQSVRAGSVIVDFSIFPSASGADGSRGPTCSRASRSQLADAHTPRHGGQRDGRRDGRALRAFEPATAIAPSADRSSRARTAAAASRAGAQTRALLPYQHGGLFSFEAGSYAVHRGRPRRGHALRAARAGRARRGRAALRHARRLGEGGARRPPRPARAGGVSLRAGRAHSRASRSASRDDGEAEDHFGTFAVELALERFELGGGGGSAASAAVGSPSVELVKVFDWADDASSSAGRSSAALSPPALSPPPPANASAADAPRTLAFGRRQRRGRRRGGARAERRGRRATGAEAEPWVDGPRARGRGRGPRPAPSTTRRATSRRRGRRRATDRLRLRRREIVRATATAAANAVCAVGGARRHPRARRGGEPASAAATPTAARPRSRRGLTLTLWIRFVGTTRPRSPRPGATRASRAARRFLVRDRRGRRRAAAAIGSCSRTRATSRLTHARGGRARAAARGLDLASLATVGATGARASVRGAAVARPRGRNDARRRARVAHLDGARVFGRRPRPRAGAARATARSCGVAAQRARRAGVARKRRLACRPGEGTVAGSATSAARRSGRSSWRAVVARALRERRRHQGPSAGADRPRRARGLYLYRASSRTRSARPRARAARNASAAPAPLALLASRAARQLGRDRRARSRDARRGRHAVPLAAPRSDLPVRRQLARRRAVWHSRAEPAASARARRASAGGCRPPARAPRSRGLDARPRRGARAPTERITTPRSRSASVTVRRPTPTWTASAILREDFGWASPNATVPSVAEPTPARAIIERRRSRSAATRTAWARRPANSRTTSTGRRRLPRLSASSAARPGASA